MPPAPPTPDSRAAATAGALSGTFACAATYPLDLIRTRQALDRRIPPLSTFSALRKVLSDEGGRALFRGLRPAVLSHAPAGAIFFTLYTRAQSHVPVQTRSGQFAVSAGFAWCVTCLAMNPMWVVKVCARRERAVIPRRVGLPRVGDGAHRAFTYHCYFLGLFHDPPDALSSSEPGHESEEKRPEVRTRLAVTADGVCGAGFTWALLRHDCK